MVITHEKELLALMGRVAEVIDPSGETIAKGLLVRLFDAGRVYWRVGGTVVCRFELRDVADLAGTVIELRRAGR